jgi:hypothetical protein
LTVPKDRYPKDPWHASQFDLIRRYLECDAKKLPTRIRGLFPRIEGRSLCVRGVFGADIEI